MFCSVNSWSGLQPENNSLQSRILGVSGRIESSSFFFFFRLIQVIVDHHNDCSSGVTKVTGKSFPNKGGTLVLITPS